MPPILTDPAFWYPTGVGLFGILVWLLKAKSDPNDDRVTSAFKDILYNHSKTTLITVLTYFGICLCLREMGQLNVAAALGAGFTNQSFTETIARVRKNGNGTNGATTNGG